VIGGGGDSGAGNAHDNLAIGGAVGGSDGDGIPAGTTVPNLPGYPSVSIQELGLPVVACTPVQPRGMLG